jgi:hypothetical protein
MRMRVSKLVYLPVGGALAAGLLTSAIVLPQSKLAASQECYSACSSTTALSVSRATVNLGAERAEQFSVSVGAGTDRTAVPSGEVTVQIGPHVVCRAHLSAARGACSLGSRQLAPGSYVVAAHYSGDANFKPSTSRGRHFTVRGLSGTELSLSRSRVPVSREWQEHFAVKVYENGRPGVRPAGAVAVMAGGHRVCVAHLSGGQGECSLRGWELHPGSYHAQAMYGGDATVAPSTSHEKKFTVVRG